LLTDLGFADARSLLQSGNLVFRGDQQRQEALEERLEAAVAERLGLQVSFMVRTGEQLARVIERNPLPDDAERDAGHLLVLFLKSAPAAEAVEALRVAVKGPEEIHADGDQLYVAYRGGVGTSRLTNTLIESKLRTRATGRNWNTVLKLAAMAG